MKSIFTLALALVALPAFAEPQANPLADISKINVSVFHTPADQAPVLAASHSYTVVPATEDGSVRSTETAYLDRVSTDDAGTTTLTPGVYVEQRGGPVSKLVYQREIAYTKSCETDGKKMILSPGTYNEGLGGYAYRTPKGEVMAQLGYNQLVGKVSTFQDGAGCSIQLPKIAAQNWDMRLTDKTTELPFKLNGESYLVRIDAE